MLPAALWLTASRRTLHVCALHLHFVYVSCYVYAVLVAGSVCQAQLSISNGVFLTKPDPYVEFSVDGQQKQRTDVERKTLQPSWNADFSVLVTVTCNHHHFHRGV